MIKKLLHRLFDRTNRQEDKAPVCCCGPIPETIWECTSRYSVSFWDGRDKDGMPTGGSWITDCSTGESVDPDDLPFGVSVDRYARAGQMACVRFVLGSSQVTASFVPSCIFNLVRW